MHESDNVQQALKLSLGQTRVVLSGPSHGPPILLVHGMTYPLEVWNHCTDSLASKGHRVLRFDLYGRGQARWNGSPLTSSVLANQAVDVLDAIGWHQPVPWVSLSNSDLVLLAAGQQHPHRCSQLLWIAPSGFDRRLMNPRVRWASRVPGIQLWMQHRLRQRCIRRMQDHRTHLDSKSIEYSGPIYDQCIEWTRSNPDFAKAVASQIRHLPTDDLVHQQLSELSSTQIPVNALLFGQEQDSTDQGVAPFLNALTSAEITTLEQGSHMGLLEDPAAVNSWLSTTLC